MIIKILEKDENGFITNFRDVTEEYVLKETDVDFGLDDEGKPIIRQDVEKIFFEEDGKEYFSVSTENELLIRLHPGCFKVYRKKLKYYPPEISKDQLKRNNENKLYEMVLKRYILEKEGLNVDEYNLEIEILKKQISELS